jgi:hypothetical protein
MAVYKSRCCSSPSVEFYVDILRQVDVFTCHNCGFSASGSREEVDAAFRKRAAEMAEDPEEVMA